MAGVPDQNTDLSAVPLFPLPNVVLFPRAVLPLHIFEERYKAMTADTLLGDRQIAMALLKPGWEKNYYQKPSIEPIVCVGTILTHERLPDGAYNFLLQGHTRARIIREHGKTVYRVAELEPLEELAASESELAEGRQRLVSIFEDTSLINSSIGRQFLQLLTGPISTTDVADLVAFTFLEDIAVKQSLLEEADVRRRIGRIIDALDEISPTLASSIVRPRTDPSLN